VEPRRAGEDERGDRLDERIVHRNRLATTGTAAAQRQPAEDGNVLPRPDLPAAARTTRPTAERRVLRQPDDADVQERADGQPQHTGEDDEGSGTHRSGSRAWSAAEP